MEHLVFREPGTQNVVVIILESFQTQPVCEFSLQEEKSIKKGSSYFHSSEAQVRLGIQTRNSMNNLSFIQAAFLGLGAGNGGIYSSRDMLHAGLEEAIQR